MTTLENLNQLDKNENNTSLSNQIENNNIKLNELDKQYTNLSQQSKEKVLFLKRIMNIFKSKNKWKEADERWAKYEQRISDLEKKLADITKDKDNTNTEKQSNALPTETKKDSENTNTVKQDNKSPVETEKDPIVSAKNQKEWTEKSNAMQILKSLYGEHVGEVPTSYELMFRDLSWSWRDITQLSLQQQIESYSNGYNRFSWQESSQTMRSRPVMNLDKPIVERSPMEYTKWSAFHILKQWPEKTSTWLHDMQKYLSTVFQKRGLTSEQIKAAFWKDGDFGHFWARLKWFPEKNEDDSANQDTYKKHQKYVFEWPENQAYDPNNVPENVQISQQENSMIHLWRIVLKESMRFTS